MKPLWRRILLALWAGLVSSAAASSFSQLFDTPSAYFGGTDNEPYLEWVGALETNYTTSTFLPMAGDTRQGVALHWRIDGDLIHLAVAARTVSNDDGGWLAFGLSPAGGMLGSDVVYWQASQPDTLTDGHIVEDRAQPLTDICQDWSLIQAETSRPGFIMWEGRRLANTQDVQDHEIMIDPQPGLPAQRVVAAWGESAQISYHGNQVVRGAVRFIDTPEIDFATQMDAAATSSFVVRATDHELRLVDTDYVDFCVSKANIVAQGVPGDKALHTIGFEPIIQPGNEKYVHHFVVTASNDAGDDACADSDSFTELAYVWAPGEQPFALPDYLGAPLFGSDFSSFNIQIHYNNPDFDSGKIDSSGVRFYVSDQLREQELGMLQIGDPFVLLGGQPVGNGLTRHTLTCLGTCSALALDEPVTVLREFLHMHKSGVRISNEVLRDGKKIHEGVIDVWEYDAQSNAVVTQGPFELQPGDSFRTTCYFRDSDGSKTFGLSSQQEMCIAFLAYYPRKLIADRFPWVCGAGLDEVGFLACSADYDRTTLESELELNRKFDTMLLGECVALEPDTVPTQSPGQPDQSSAAAAAGGGGGYSFLASALALMTVCTLLWPHWC